ncbi:MAG: prepilin-type N-terminal cleavage/methylation domain-containing protein [Bacilli bacterium]|nr:prepilin-type N-terminal cleavage/methylation domain-containing protein [Bacilli bacterium]MDD4644048.1 prepilin-type N-terminal cleavage/methylation domain-containing protein [Bacilli bacterium]
MKNKSFTLIELLVVIVIIGILAGVIIISVNSSIDKANFAKAQAFSSTVQNELLGDLVSEWTFDEGDAEDSWGNNDGTVVGATYKTKASGECVYGGCYSFGVADDYITYGDVFRFETGDFTVSFWTFYSAGTWAFITKGMGFHGTNGWGISRESNGVSVALQGRVGTPSNALLPRGAWSHVVVTFDRSDVGKTYVNGSLKDSYNISSKLIITGDASPLLIGKYGSNSDMSALMDDVRIYNAVLSSAQIKQQYIAGLDSLLAKGSISEEEYEQGLNNLAYEK